MDSAQFDRLTKAFAQRVSRRSALASLLVGGMTALHVRPGDAKPACRGAGHPCEGNQTCCPGLACVAGGGQGSASRCVGDAQVTVFATLEYTVEVACDYDTDADETSCVFVGDAGEGIEPIAAIVIPVDTVCEGAVVAECELIDTGADESSAGVPKGRGYRSTAKDEAGRPRCTLVFPGQVVPISSDTYWCETGDGLHPAEGPALSCPEAPAAEEIPEILGAALIHAFACPADGRGSDVDWFASCPPETGTSEFQLQLSGDATVTELETASSSAGEPATFAALEPGAYELIELDRDWCHAESDNTNEAGEVVIEAGKRTNVWVFHCPAGGS